MDDTGTVGNPALGRFLTIADTAEILNLTISQTYALVRSGEIPAIKVGAGGHWRVERSVLESYIQAMYEETRRLSLWHQSEFASGADVGSGAANGVDSGPGFSNVTELSFR